MRNVTSGSAEAETAQHRIASIVGLVRNEKDGAVRAQLVTQLGEFSEPEAVRQLLALYAAESDPEVKQAILAQLGNCPASSQLASEVKEVLQRAYAADTDLDNRRAIIDAAAEIDSSETAAFLRNIYNDTNADPAERLTAATSLVRMGTRNDETVLPADSKQIDDWLKVEAQASAESADMRCEAIMGLAERRDENREFFQQMLRDETDPNVRRLLEQLTSGGSNQPQAPPASTPGVRT